MEFYSFDKLDATGANWRIVVGERSSGKSYGTKKKMIENFLRDGKQFAYVRRNVEEVKPRRVSVYFDDMLKDGYIEKTCRKHFGKEYKGFYIVPKNGAFYLHAVKKEVDEILGKIGYYFALNQARYDKTVSYPDVNMIVFDEFLCHPNEEISDEFTMLLNLVSTIKRKREDMVIYLLGNTMNRSSQILDEMGINLRTMKQGEIKVFDFYSESAHNTVAVEYTGNFEQSEKSESFFTFGNQKERMITKGEWETGDYKTLAIPVGYTDETVQLAIVFQSSDFKLYGYLTYDDTGYVSEKRLPDIKSDYVVITTGESIPSRMTFCLNDPRVWEIMTYVRTLHDIGALTFDKNVTGYDFEIFMRSL